MKSPHPGRGHRGVSADAPSTDALTAGEPQSDLNAPDPSTDINGPASRSAGLACRFGRLTRFGWLTRFTWLPFGLAIAGAVVLAAVYSQTVQGSDQTLVAMGFDTERAQLITSLVIGGVAAAAVALGLNRPRYATLLGLGALAALFSQTFWDETQRDAGLTGALGTFDPIGWVLTLVTLAMIGLVASWAGATLAMALRPTLVASVVAVRDVTTAVAVDASVWVSARAGRGRSGLRARRPDFRSMRRPLAVVLVLVLLGVTLPAFGNMVNLTPDTYMLQGVDKGGGLAPGGSYPDVSFAAPSDTPTPSPTSEIAANSPTQSASPTARITAAPGTKPWLAWKPTGSGQVTKVMMPAPWKGGTASTSEIDVYTPPGYKRNGTRLYPVIYEAPTGLTLWNSGTNVISALDTLIDSGDIPPVIVVFIDSLNAPYGDTECADMYDGSQWFETYIYSTVVTFVDQQYRTIPDPSARTVMGMSAGGFCSAMLAMRHPGTFSVSISFSGYYWAGANGPVSAKPFGSEIVSHSPALIAPTIPPEYRSRLYFILVACEDQTNGACPKQDFYIWHATNFEKILKADGYQYLNISSYYTHGWTQVRYETPGVLEAWAAREVINGVW
jgi:esterase/lipase superfamily enzyme